MTLTKGIELSITKDGKIIQESHCRFEIVDVEFDGNYEVELKVLN